MKKKGWKQRKVHLIFDEKERTEFLTGQRKRNLERKMKKEVKIKAKLKQEKNRIKNSQKGTLQNLIQSQRGVPEVQHLLEPVTYDLPDHTVTVSHINNMDSINASAIINMDETLPTVSVPESRDEVEKLTEIIRDLKKKTIKTLQKSKAQGMAQDQQRKRDKQKAKRLRKIFEKNMKRSKKRHSKKYQK
ncbi:uncharacterized protein NPIL_135561 [Nephila pilipes]|uniref:Nucleolar protein 12 n=1 Tax=Nephila pilipes TaxID=299642 RepID=A0A8X6N6Y6_NEPPI|nr:uncharacterized protein NPIL_135561 [Nephila pilipes]